MGYGDDEPPAVRADPFPATLQSSSGFKILILTFVEWKYIKLFWSVDGGPLDDVQVLSGQKSTDYVFKPARSGARYAFSARGCSDDAYCSPTSRPIERTAAVNTHSLRTFLVLSGINIHPGVHLRALITHGSRQVRLRALLGVD
jgi:hypothetical protein